MIVVKAVEDESSNDEIQDYQRNAIIGGTYNRDRKNTIFGPETGAKGIIKKRNNEGWDVVISIPLEGRGIQLYDGLVVGFQTSYDDDDDDDDARDHKLIWGKSDRGYKDGAGDDIAYRDPSHLDKLEFCNIQKDTDD